jgi:hypothetical protein
MGRHHNGTQDAPVAEFGTLRLHNPLRVKFGHTMSYYREGKNCVQNPMQNRKAKGSQSTVHYSLSRQWLRGVGGGGKISQSKRDLSPQPYSTL